MQNGYTRKFTKRNGKRWLPIGKRYSLKVEISDGQFGIFAFRRRLHNENSMCMKIQYPKERWLIK
jgi:hypothetical protein